jgi:hypothetical protein
MRWLASISPAPRHPDNGAKKVVLSKKWPINFFPTVFVAQSPLAEYGGCQKQ